MKKTEKLIALLAFCSICALGSSGCARRSDASNENDQDWKRPLVLTTSPQKPTESASLKYSGVAKETRTVKTSFRVPGPVIEICSEIGKRVKKGEPLAKLDPRDFVLAESQAREALKEAEANLAAMKTGARAEDVAALEAALEAANSQLNVAKTNEERFARLLETKSAPQAKYDEMKMKLDQSIAAVEVAKQNLAKATTGARREEIDAMEAKIASIKKQIEKAQNALGDSVIYAPSDGYVSQKYVEVGEIVAPGIPVLAFTDSEKTRVKTAISESALARRDQIKAFHCEFETYPGKRFPARLYELGLAQQAGKQGYPLEVDVDVLDGVEILPGMTATVVVEFNGDEDALEIPISALLPDDDFEPGQWTGETRDAFVWRVDSETGKLVKTPVVIERVSNSGVVVKGELTEDDQIVSVGAKFLRENEDVRVKENVAGIRN